MDGRKKRGKEGLGGSAISFIIMNHSRATRKRASSESGSDYSDDPKSRTSASSRVNFSKLTNAEKE